MVAGWCGWYALWNESRCRISRLAHISKTLTSRSPQNLPRVCMATCSIFDRLTRLCLWMRPTHHCMLPTKGIPSRNRFKKKKMADVKFYFLKMLIFFIKPKVWSFYSNCIINLIINYHKQKTWGSSWSMIWLSHYFILVINYTQYYSI